MDPEPLSCPLVDSLGNPFDPSDGPDLYIDIVSSTGTVVCSHLWIKMNVTSGNFPLIYSSETTYSISSSDWNNTYYIKIRESDNYVFAGEAGYVTFVPANYTTISSHYPPEVTLTNGSTEIKLALTW